MSDVNYVIDEWGKWEVREGTKILTEPSQKWIDENQPETQSEPQPTELELLMDYIIDVDFRVVLLELGLI